MAFKTRGFTHIGIRVKDLEGAREFYTQTLGFRQVQEAEGVVLVDINGVLLSIHGNSTRTRKGDRFNPYKVGLDHLALGVEANELEDLKTQLDAAGIANNGIEDDAILGGRYISFQDPEGIAWELYAMPAQ